MIFQLTSRLWRAFTRENTVDGDDLTEESLRTSDRLTGIQTKASRTSGRREKIAERAGSTTLGETAGDEVSCREREGIEREKDANQLATN